MHGDANNDGGDCRRVAAACCRQVRRSAACTPYEITANALLWAGPSNVPPGVPARVSDVGVGRGACGAEVSAPRASPRVLPAPRSPVDRFSYPCPIMPMSGITRGVLRGGVSSRKGRKAPTAVPKAPMASPMPSGGKIASTSGASCVAPGARASHAHVARRGVVASAGTNGNGSTGENRRAHVLRARVALALLCADFGGGRAHRLPALPDHARIFVGGNRRFRVPSHSSIPTNQRLEGGFTGLLGGLYRSPRSRDAGPGLPPHVDKFAESGGGYRPPLARWACIRGRPAAQPRVTPVLGRLRADRAPRMVEGTAAGGTRPCLACVPPTRSPSPPPARPRPLLPRPQTTWRTSW